MELFLSARFAVRSQDWAPFIRAYNIEHRGEELALRSTSLFSTLAVLRPGPDDGPANANFDGSLFSYTAEFRWTTRKKLRSLLGVDLMSRIERRLVIPPKCTIFRARSAAAREDTLALINAELVRDFDARLAALGLQPVRARIDPALPADAIVLDFVQAPPPTELPANEVYVDTKAGEALLRGADLYVPGVAGCTATNQKGDAVSVYVDLDSCLRKGQKRLSNVRRRIFVGVGALWWAVKKRRRGALRYAHVLTRVQGECHVRARARACTPALIETRTDRARA